MRPNTSLFPIRVALHCHVSNLFYSLTYEFKVKHVWTSLSLTEFKSKSFSKSSRKGVWGVKLWCYSSKPHITDLLKAPEKDHFHSAAIPTLKYTRPPTTGVKIFPLHCSTLSIPLPRKHHASPPAPPHPLWRRPVVQNGRIQPLSLPVVHQKHRSTLPSPRSRRHSFLAWWRILLLVPRPATAGVAA